MEWFQLPMDMWHRKMQRHMLSNHLPLTEGILKKIISLKTEKKETEARSCFQKLLAEGNINGSFRSNSKKAEIYIMDPATTGLIILKRQRHKSTLQVSSLERILERSVQWQKRTGWKGEPYLEHQLTEGNFNWISLLKDREEDGGMCNSSSC